MDGDLKPLLQVAVTVLIVVAIIGLLFSAVRRSAKRLSEERRKLLGDAARRLGIPFYEKDKFDINKLISRFRFFKAASTKQFTNVAVNKLADSQTCLCEYTQSGRSGQSATIAKYTLCLIQDRRLPKANIVIMPSTYERFKKLATKIFGENLQDVGSIVGAERSIGYWIFASDPQLAECRLDSKQFREIVSVLKDFELDLAVQINERILVMHTLADKKRVDDVDQLVRFAEKAKQIHNLFISACTSM